MALLLFCNILQCGVSSNEKEKQWKHSTVSLSSDVCLQALRQKTFVTGLLLEYYTKKSQLSSDLAMVRFIRLAVRASEKPHFQHVVRLACS